MRTDLRHFSSLSIVLTLVSLSLSGVLAGCAFNPPGERAERRPVQMTTSQELALGKSALRQAVQRGGGAYPDPQLSAYVDAVGQRLVRQIKRSKLRFRFVVINDSVPNAFALPGGYVAITRGLLVGIPSEATLAALLGHEVAHLTSRHWLQGLSPEALREVSDANSGRETTPVESGVIAPDGDKVAAELIDQRYSRSQETEADLLGLDYMVKSGYAPTGALELQQLFARLAQAGTNSLWKNGLFLGHPFSAERFAANRRYIDEHYPVTGGERRGEAEFARVITTLSRTQQGYATHDQARQMEHEGRIAEAIALYHRALLEAHDEPLILCRLGLAYLRGEDLVPARRYLIKAVNLQGDYYQSRLALGYVYLQKKQYAKARAQLEAGFQLLPTLEGGYLLAQARENLGDIEGARSLYEAVISAAGADRLARHAADRLRMLR